MKGNSMMDENEKYNLPCPFNPEVMCIQMPSEPEDDNYCDDGCPNSRKTCTKLRKIIQDNA